MNPAADANGAHSEARDGSSNQHRHTETKSLGQALREAGLSLNSASHGSETPSEEDYDENVRPAFARRSHSDERPAHVKNRKPRRNSRESHTQKSDAAAAATNAQTIRISPDDEKVLQELLKQSLDSVRHPGEALKKKRKFRDHLFTHQFSAFDPHNSAAANSPFHGFYTLFWLAVALFMLKICVNNWIVHGTPLGSNEIMRYMFRRDGECRTLLGSA